MAKYGGLDIYYEHLKKRYTIDHEDIQFVKNKGCALIGLTDEPDGSSTDYENFSIYDDFFDRIMAMHQNLGITLKNTDKDIIFTNQ